MQSKTRTPAETPMSDCWHCRRLRSLSCINNRRTGHNFTTGKTPAHLMKTDNQNLTEIPQTPKRWHRIPCVPNWAMGWTNICQKPQLNSIWPGVNWCAQARAWREHGVITARVGGRRWMELWGQSLGSLAPGAYLTERGDLAALPENGMLNVSLTLVTSA